MFADYKAQVTLAYKKSREHGTLSLNLIQSTPAKLRAECMMVLNERYLKKDENTLRVFFGPKSDAAAYMNAIRKFDADKFKPLDNFLKGITNDTEDKNIELLAWLINFEPRPYRFEQTNMVSEPEVAYRNTRESLRSNIVEEPLPGTPTGNTAQRSHKVKGDELHDSDKITQPLQIKPKVTQKTAPVINVKYLIIVFLIIAIAVLGIFGSLYLKTTEHTLHYTPAMIGEQRCMYWAGDYYEPVDCNKKIGDTLVIALDTGLLNNFKKITKPDTVTANSIGKLWYFRIRNHIELYTKPGIHPVFFDRRLLPLSRPILNKYILHIEDNDSTEYNGM